MRYAILLLAMTNWAAIVSRDGGETWCISKAGLRSLAAAEAEVARLRQLDLPANGPLPR